VVTINVVIFDAASSGGIVPTLQTRLLPPLSRFQQGD